MHWRNRTADRTWTCSFRNFAVAVYTSSASEQIGEHSGDDVLDTHPLGLPTSAPIFDKARGPDERTSAHPLPELTAIEGLWFAEATKNNSRRATEELGGDGYVLRESSR